MWSAWTRSGPIARAIPAATHAESGPPEASTTPDEMASTRPLRRTASVRRSRASSLPPISPILRRRAARAAATRRLALLVVRDPLGSGVRLAGPGNEELDRLRESLQLDAADRIEFEIARLADRVRDCGGDHHLATESPRDHAMGEVHLASEVVAVPIYGATAVDAHPRLGPLLEQAEEPDRPLGERHGVRGDDHHLVADRLDDERLGWKRRLNSLDESLHEVERLLIPLLLRVTGEPGQVDEAERHLDPAQLALPRELGLHVADDVLLDVEAQVALVDLLHQWRRDREEVSRESLHLLRHLKRVDPLPDEGLVDVQVEQPHLRLGDLANRLGVDPDELEQRHQWKPCPQDVPDVLHRHDVLLVEGSLEGGGRTQQRHHPLDQGLLEARPLRRFQTRHVALAPRKEVLDVAERQTAFANRAAQLGERMPPFAQPAHDPGLSRRGGGPPPAPDRDHPCLDPPLQGG